MRIKCLAQEQSGLEPRPLGNRASHRCFNTTFKTGDDARILHYKITEPLRVLSLVDRCVYMRECKHGCDVSDLRVFLRIVL